MKRDNMAKRSSLGSMVRRRLSDITNVLPQTKSPVIPENIPQDPASAKEYIDFLLKEKMALVKLIQDKNKIIELSGTEIQNLKTCLQKMQLQNWSLAQSNSNMLAELNLGRTRLKMLQHELACKDALIKTKNIELKQRQDEIISRTSELMQSRDRESDMEALESECNEDIRPRSVRRRRRHTRSRSLGSSMVSQQLAERETAEGKRRCLRRQSSGSRIRRQEPNENLFEIDETKFPVVKPHKYQNPEVGISVSSSPPKKDVSGSCEPTFNSEGRGRTSVGRPLRRAVEKVQTYKERPVNVKMRRPE